MTIDALIDKVDNSEAIRDQIAAILVTEVAAQKVLATAAAEDPIDWDLKVYTERANAFEAYLNDPAAGLARTPIVNVWVENSTYEKSGSNVMQRQHAETTFNIDCYGYAVASTDGGSGHNPGDREAAFEVQRAVRLVRNILMADIYTYLALRGLVGSRWPQSVTLFQPELDNNQVQQVVGARIALKVDYNEFSPQQTPETLDYLSVCVKRVEDGEIVLTADYDYTL